MSERLPSWISAPVNKNGWEELGLQFGAKWLVMQGGNVMQSNRRGRWWTFVEKKSKGELRFDLPSQEEFDLELHERKRMRGNSIYNCMDNG